MKRSFRSALLVACAAWVLAGPVERARAEPSALSPALVSSLENASAQGPQQLLLSVYNNVLAHPELAQAIRDQASVFQPGLAPKIAVTVSQAQTAMATGAAPARGLELTVTHHAAVSGGSAVGGLTTSGWIVGGVLVAGAIGAGVAIAAASDSGSDPELPNYDNEYARNWGLAAIGVNSLYSGGYTGNGVTVGVVDSGIDSDYSEFVGRIASGGQNFIGGRTASNVEDTTYDGHGTHVSGIIAANRDGYGMHGVAYGAEILPLRVFETDNTGSYVASPSEIADAINYGVTQGVQVFNGSYGYLADTDVAATEVEFDAYQAAVNAGSILVFAAGNDSWADPGMPAAVPYIKPANDAAATTAHIYTNNTNAKDYSALASQLLAVVSVDQSGVISSFSNRCGVAAAWCLAAPGGSIYSTYPEHTYATLDGTSMAAPHVAGALALLIEKYPSLTPAQVVTRLLTTATKTGIYADTSVYGQGMLNLTAASAFVATPTVLTGSSVAGPSFTLAESRVSLGSAFGDGLSRALASKTMTVVDSFDGATFAMKADVMTQAPELSNRLADGLRAFGRETETVHAGDAADTTVAWRDVPGGLNGERAKRETRVTTAFSPDTRVSVGYMDDPSVGLGLVADGTVTTGESRSSGAFLSPYLGFASDGFSMVTDTKMGHGITVRAASFSGHAEDEEDAGAYGAATELAYTPFAGSRVSVQTGFVSEENSFLGSRSSGAAALGRTDTTYVGFSASVDVAAKTELVGSYFLGSSAVQTVPGSLVRSISGVTSDSFSLGLIQHDAAVSGDRFGLVLNQPLRVRGGSAELDLPTSVNRDLEVGYSATQAGLTPSGRELDVEAFYAAPLSDTTTLNTSVMYRHQPDHVASADDEAQVLLRVNHTY